MNQYEVGTTILLETTFLNELGQPYTPTIYSGLILEPDGIQTYYALSAGSGAGNYFFKHKIAKEGEHTYSFIAETPASTVSTVSSDFFIAIQYESHDLDYLIPQLREHLGDRDTRVYTTDFLRQSLFSAFKALIPRWRYRYIINAQNIISRNVDKLLEFVFVEPPIIQKFDERPIVLQASTIIKTGVLYSTRGNFVSWRDDEISLSNLEGSRLLTASLKRDIDELDMLLPPRAKKLAVPSKQSLTGFTVEVGNAFEG